MAAAIAAPASPQSTPTSSAEVRDHGRDGSPVSDARLIRAQVAAAEDARQEMAARAARRRASYHSPLRGGE